MHFFRDPRLRPTHLQPPQVPAQAVSHRAPFSLRPSRDGRRSARPHRSL
jgi:hypothetical protein